MKKLLSQLLPALLIIALSVSFINKQLSTNAISNLNIDPGGVVFRTLAPASNVGALDGEFAVDHNGGATYNILIDVPPGTNDVAPQLSITYTSQQGNGGLGVGWNLNGLASIQRVGKSIAQNGIKGGVSLTNSDQFTIGGQRLVPYRDKNGNLLNTQALRDAANGQDGTEYHTEIESWTRFYSFGNCGNGPCYFTAIAKDGSTSQFGYTSDSRNNSGNNSNAALEWLINKSSDRNGNYTTVTYQNNGASWYYPSLIYYTANDNAGLPAQRAVQFFYESRNDQIINYIGGRGIIINNRLSSIQTFVDRDGNGQQVNIAANLVLQYKLSYGYSQATSSSLISQIQVCDAANNCLPASTFTYGRDRSLSANVFSNSTYNYSSLRMDASSCSLLQGDFNGDGYTDFIRQEKVQNTYKSLAVFLSNGQGSFTASTYTGNGSDNFSQSACMLLMGDYNGDGFTDFMWQPKSPAGKNLLIFISNGSNSFNRVSYTAAENVDQASAVLVPGDYNGDGRVDFLRQGKSRTTQFSIYYSTGSGTFSNSSYTATTNIDAASAILIPGDFNGDGIGDFLNQSTSLSSNQVQVYWFNSNGQLQNTITQGSSSYPLDIKNSNLVFGDFNGDNNTDFARQSRINQTKTMQIFTANSNASFSTAVVNFSTNMDYNSVSLMAVDINGDGLSDLLSQSNLINTSTFTVSYSLAGTSFTNAYTYTGSSPLGTKDAAMLIGDYNGDAASDFITQKISSTNALPVYLSLVTAPNLLTQIQTGLGQITQVQYAPITTDSVYIKGSGAAYPLLNLEAPLWVTVGQVATDNAGTSFAFAYKYKNGLINLQRGWLGYGTTYTKDLQNSSLKISVFNTNFPYTGSVMQERTTDLLDTSKCLGQTLASYSSTPFLNGAVYSVYNTQSQVQSYTNGTYNYTITKNFQYDASGSTMILQSNLGDQSSSNDDVYTGLQYGTYSSTSADWWKAFFPISQKMAKTATAASNFNNWNASTDLKWEKYNYDLVMNMDTDMLFRNTSGGNNPVLNTWITTGFQYDKYGNETQRIEADTIRWTTYFDSTYHTFPVLLQSPKPSAVQKELFSSAYFDPRFGVKVANIDPNGNYDLYIPNLGLDGVGAVLITQSSSPSNKTPVSLTQTLFNKGSSNRGAIVTIYNRVSWSQSDTSQWVWSSDYTDAFSRNYLSTRKGYNAGTPLNIKTGYDSRGNPSFQYIPYFQTGTSSYTYSPAGPAYSNPAYYIHEYDRHGRPFRNWAPNPDTPGSSYLVKEISYLLNNNRQVVFRIPDPNTNGQYVKWVQAMDLQGNVLGKYGPYGDNMQVLSITDTTLYTYDLLGQLLSITDPLGEITSFTYNSTGQHIQESKPETGTTIYQYDLLNQLSQEQDACGNLKRYNYDRLGRQTLTRVYDSTGVVTGTYTYEYDLDSMSNSKGRLSRTVIPAGTYTYNYDNIGLVSEEQVKLNDLSGTYVTQYQYDAMARISQVTFPDRSVVNYNYTHYDGNLASITEGSDTLASFAMYTSTGNSTSIKYKNEVISNYHYDFLSRMDSLRVSRRAYIQRLSALKWNRANNLKNIADVRPAEFKDNSNYSESFSYDQSGRIIAATGDYDPGLSDVTCTYQYDAAGNRTAFSKTGGSGPSSYTINYNPSKKHQISSIAYSNGITQQYTFNADGNLSAISSNSSTARYNFSAADVLASVNMPAGAPSTQYSYNAAGKRVVKTAADTSTFYINNLYEVVKYPGNTGTLHTRYVGGPRGAVQSKSQNGSNIQLLQPAKKSGFIPWSDINENDLYKHTGQGIIIAGLLLFLLMAFMPLRKKGLRAATANSFLFLTRIRWKNEQVPMFDLSRLGQCLNQLFLSFLTTCFLLVNTLPVQAQSSGSGYPQSGKTLYFTYDEIGSNIIVTDQAGSSDAVVTYEPFGSIGQLNGTNNFRPKYTGNELDQSTGLYYFGARYYNSDIGRFISPDPAMQYNSPYIYGYDDPYGGTDPDGEFFVVLAVLITAGIIGAYAGGAIANGNANPVKWDWTAGKTWAGIIGGAAVGVTVAAAAMAGLAAVGIIGAEAVSIGGVSAGSIAFASADVAFLTYDSYQFAQNPNIENGIFVALDLIPFLGPLIGRAVRGVRAMSRATDIAAHETELAARTETKLAEPTEEIMHSACPLSLAAGTEVLTATGLKPIEAIEVGDEVYSYNENTGKNELHPVSMVLKRQTTGMMYIIIPGDTIQTTESHPFFVQKKGWIDASLLVKGDKLQLENGSYLNVLSVGFLPSATYTVYNLSVSGTHDFFVSERSVLSHNVAAACLQNKGIKRPGWRTSVKETLITEQSELIGGKTHVVSAVSDEAYPLGYKITIGSHGRTRTVWDIDHIVSYKYLLKAAYESHDVVTWAKMCDISNDVRNLRLLTMEENVSHLYEMGEKEGMKWAREILSWHGIK